MDINKTDIKIMASQRLDDTTQGGGQMTATEIVSGAINDLFPDISRLDRVYGRVSLRKAFLSVQTLNRPVYYGSHGVLTKNASDPNVSVCFFSSENWFDTREEARQRIESYLVQGPFMPAALWGNHYLGTRGLSLFMNKDFIPPEIGDVLVLVQNEGLASENKQFIRIVDITEELHEFFNGDNPYYKKVITVEIGNNLLYDFKGEEISINTAYSSSKTKIYTTVAADASKYYGVTTLKEAAQEHELQIRVDSIKTALVPSAQSQTAITDAGIGQAITPMLQTDDSITSVVRNVSFAITANSKLYIGEGVLPGSFSWVGGISLTDDSTGNIVYNGDIVGSIAYDTGIITFTNVSGSTSGTGTVTYIPACAPTAVASTGGIRVEINNRGFVYTYICDPLPKPGTLKVDYYSGGKWYSIQDRGDGALRGSDQSIGSGSVNFLTGSVSLTLGAMPDIGSMVLLFWATNAPYYNLNGETLGLQYQGVTQDPGVTRGTFYITWGNNTNAAVDDADGNLRVGSFDGTWHPSGGVIGAIKYATGEYSFSIGGTQNVPLSSENFVISYSYGDKHQESFNPIRNPNGTVSFFLSNAPIRPNTFKIEWHTNQIEYIDAENAIMRVHSVDPTHIFQDNGTGGFEHEDASEFSSYIASSINYTTGEVMLMPDRVGTFPVPTYKWSNLIMTNLQEDELNNPSQSIAYVFDRTIYFSAASLWPTNGIFVCDYCAVDGTNTKSYTQTIQKTFIIKSNSFLELVPGSLSFIVGSSYATDVSGKLYINISGVTGVGTEIGTINYAERKIVITNDSITARTISIVSASGTAKIDPVQLVLFRTPGAPLTPGSLGIQATMPNGTHITGSSNFAGEITGTYMTGKINYETGVGQIAFGQYVTDTYTALPPEQRPIWYDDELIVGANIWKPISVSLSTVSINCVVQSYLPLDADLLGLDPVRLPLDGKVPIFRDGDIILVHHTLKQNLPNPVVKGTTYNMSRQDVDLIELYDSTGLYYPEVNGGVINYTVDLALGTVTIANTASFTGFTQPFYAIHRIEDMCLASDVQITGHIAITNPLTHDFPANETLVSSILPSADLQARAYNEIVQSTWTGVWSDDLIGTAPLANYDFVNYPITVHNNGATKERWLIKFKTTTTIDVIGEHLGVLASDLNITTLPNNKLEVINRLTGEVYWSMNALGFGLGWSSGNCIRFNTDAANFPYWFVRTTLQGPPTLATDSYEFQVRGDSA